MSFIQLASGLHIGSAQPVDDRFVKADVTTIPSALRYEGLVAYQTTNTGATFTPTIGLYLLEGGITDSSWVAVGSGGGGGSADKLGLTATAVKTANFTASPGDLVICDASAGSFTVTLPTAPANGTVIGAKLALTAAGHTVSVAAGGTDVFDQAAWGASYALSLNEEGAIFQYRNASGIWYVAATALTVAQLDSRYSAAGAAGGGYSQSFLLMGG